MNSSSPHCACRAGRLPASRAPHGLAAARPLPKAGHRPAPHCRHAAGRDRDWTARSGLLRCALAARKHAAASAAAAFQAACCTCTCICLSSTGCGQCSLLAAAAPIRLQGCGIETMRHWSPLQSRQKSEHRSFSAPCYSVELQVSTSAEASWHHDHHTGYPRGRPAGHPVVCIVLWCMPKASPPA